MSKVTITPEMQQILDAMRAQGIDPATMRKASIQDAKDKALSDEIERQQALAFSALGKMYQRTFGKTARSLLLEHPSVEDSQRLYVEFKTALPADAIVIGTVSCHAKQEPSELLALLVSRKDVENEWYAVGKEVKTRGEKITVTVGSILVTDCLHDSLASRFYVDFPSLDPDQDNKALVNGMVTQALAA